MNDEQNRILKIEVRLKDHLESEVQRLTEEISKQNDAIKCVEKERERYDLRSSANRILIHF